MQEDDVGDIQPWRWQVTMQSDDWWGAVGSKEGAQRPSETQLPRTRLLEWIQWRGGRRWSSGMSGVSRGGRHHRAFGGRWWVLCGTSAFWESEEILSSIWFHGSEIQKKDPGMWLLCLVKPWPWDAMECCEGRETEALGLSLQEFLGSGRGDLARRYLVCQEQGREKALLN